MLNNLLLAKIQPTANTDSVPTAGANAILCSRPEVAVLNPNIVKRNNVASWMGNPGSVITSVFSRLQFEVECQSSGAAGTAPKHGPLHRMCGMGESISAGVSVAYSPISTNQEMGSLHWYLDGIRHIFTDARGDISWALNAQGIPVIKFNLTGFHGIPTDTANPGGVDYTGFKDPLPVNKANTGTFTLHGIVTKVLEFELGLNNNVVYRNAPNVEEVVITNRDPKGRIKFEIPDTVASKDWEATVKAMTKGALSIIHGSTAGLIVQFAAPAIQLTDISIEESDGIAVANVPFDVCWGNSGNDDVVVTYR